MKIVDYMIIYDYATHNLVRTVISYMKDGWQPLGGVACNGLESHNTRHFQAMVKYEKVPAKEYLGP